MMGRKVVQESSQQLLVLKCSTLHMEHCGLQRIEVDQCSLGESLQSDILLRIDMLVLSVPQQCKSSTVVALVDRGSLLHLLVHDIDFQLPFQHTVAVFQKC